MTRVGRRRRTFGKIAAGLIVLAGIAGVRCGPAFADDQPITIGASVPYLNDPSWVMITNYAQYVAKQLNIRLLVIDAAGKEDKQLADVQSLISRRVAAIIFVPVSTADARSAILLADHAKIPIIVADRYPGFPAKNPDAPYLTFIGPDNVAAGRAVANYLFAHGVRNLVAIGGTPGDPNNQTRVQGLHEALKTWSDKGVKLVQYVGVLESEENGYAAMQNLLSAHPKGTIDGLWCYNDALCLGAYRAIKQAGRQNEIKIGAMDLDKDALALVNGHTNYIYDFGGHWVELGFAEMIAYDALHGHPPLAQFSQIEDLGVDASGFGTFKKEYLDSEPPIDIKHYMLTFNPTTTTQVPPLLLK
ncbi:MAG TPA: substrate-binding domain-containing protein [Acetobacteraceae bacterium]|nr:substrate-binding domain-containing protein [Acetobacteraceae bacterium]